MSNLRILVLGTNGQVGSSIKKISSAGTLFEYKFADRNEIDISDANSISQIKKLNVKAIINAAAYTYVDLAESEFTKAWASNSESSKLIAKLCCELSIPYIHYSSDYVYDNGQDSPLNESDPCSPKSAYAISKFEGEQAALYYNPKTIIIRTSWLYSEYGNNFVKTILKLINEKPEINVVNDQIGAPTYATDLANLTLSILEKVLTNHDFNSYGIYNYSNEGQISWFDFATEITRLSKSTCTIKPISTAELSRPAKRPAYSVFDMTKIKKVFDIKPLFWKDSLGICIKNLSQINR